MKFNLLLILNLFTVLLYGQKFNKHPFIVSDSNFVDKISWTNVDETIFLIGNLNTKQLSLIDKTDNNTKLIYFSLSYKENNIWKANVLSYFNRPRLNGHLYISIIDYNTINIYNRDFIYTLKKKYD